MKVFTLRNVRENRGGEPPEGALAEVGESHGLQRCYRYGFQKRKKCSHSRPPAATRSSHPQPLAGLSSAIEALVWAKGFHSCSPATVSRAGGRLGSGYYRSR